MGGSLTKPFLCCCHFPHGASAPMVMRRACCPSYPPLRGGTSFRYPQPEAGSAVGCRVGVSGSA